MKNTTVNIDGDKHHELKMHCASIKVPMGTFVELAVSEKMEREPHERV